MKQKIINLQIIKFALTITSITVIIFVKSSASWSNINSIFAVIKDPLYDLSVGVLSAMILVWLIDGINEKNRNIDEQKRREVLCIKIVPIVKEYYSFYIYLYIASCDHDISEDIPALANLFSKKDELIKKAIENDILAKESPFYETADDIINVNMQPPEKMKWYWCWIFYNKQFYRSIISLEQNFESLFTTELLECTENLLRKIRPINNKSDEIKKLFTDKIVLPTRFTEKIVKNNDLRTVLDLLENLMLNIQNESGQDIFSISFDEIEAIEKGDALYLS